MAGCALDEDRRNEAIMRFEKILGRQNLRFLNEIFVAPVSRIGVPNLVILLRNAWVSGGRGLCVIRVMGLTLASMIMLLDMHTYLYIGISLITSSLTFLWLDSVVIWIQNGQPKNRTTWMVGSIVLSAFMALGIGLPTGIFTTMAITIEAVRVWEFYLVAVLSDVTLNFFGAFGAYWIFITVTNSNRVLFEERFVALRKCLRSRQQADSLPNRRNAIEYAKSMETRLATAKCVLLWLVPLLIYIAQPISPPLQADVYFTLAAASALVGLIVLGAALAHFGKRTSMLLRTALTTVIIATFIASLPFAFSNFGSWLLGLCYALGAVLLIALLKSYEGVLGEKPEILGQRYFEYHLAALESDELERFIEETIEQLDSLIVP